eukprot:COSAG06_NODE_6405_length_2946_cov_239.568144_1_plen_77_part_00
MPTDSFIGSSLGLPPADSPALLHLQQQPPPGGGDVHDERNGDDCGAKPLPPLPSPSPRPPLPPPPTESELRTLKNR